MNTSPRHAAAFKSGDETYSSAIALAHRYTAWMVSPFRPFLGGDIVEVGIGHSGYYGELKPYGRYLGLDIDAASVHQAQQKFPEARFGVADVTQPDFIAPFLPDKADCIVSINVLEHIVDDRAALANLVDALKPGGRLMLNVPALMSLYNDLDRLAGHYRRYSCEGLRELLREQPVDIEFLRYFNPIGGLGWWANKFLRHHSLNSDSVRGQTMLFEKYILPFSQLLDPLTRRFFGQSVICMARKR